MLQILNLMLTGVLSVVVFGLYKKTGNAKACVISMGFFVLVFYLDGLFALIMQGFLGVDSKLLLQILGVAISKSIAVAVLLGMRVLADEHAEEIAGWKYYDVLTVSISAFFLLLGVMVRWQKGNADIQLIAMLMLMILLVVYYISQYFYLRKQRIRVIQSLEAGRKYEAEVYLENVENNYQRTRELWHDLKNHINLMSLLVQDEKYEELKEYLRIFNEDVDSLTLPARSGNLIVDALLADKVAKAKREKVEVSLELCNLEALKCKPDEICGLLGNLLDNALEANRHLREGRSLEVTCKELEECYYIRVRNPVSGTVQRPKQDFRNQVGHGLGLRSAERIVHGCGGEMMVDNGEKYFTVVVRLPR